MTQFYTAHTTATDLEFTPLEFEHPVRKTCVVTNVRFSIIEYGTGGNIDWYK